MKTIFLVTGTSGDYSYRCEWVVGYTLTKEAAEAHVVKLTNVYGADAALADAALYDKTDFDDADSHFGSIFRMLMKFEGDFAATTYRIREVSLIEDE